VGFAGENVTVQLALVSLLILVVALLVMRAATRERKDYARFKRLRTTEARQKFYRRWLKESFFMFGGLSVVVLLAVHPFIPAALADSRSWPPLTGIVDGFVAGTQTPAGAGLLIGAGVAIVTLLVLPVILLRSHIGEIPTVGDVGALIPRTGAEIRYGAGLAINAGLFEELLFRLAMPALLFGITGSGPWAFIIASALFGALHIYQGTVGVLVTFVLGLVFSFVYVLTGSILVVIALHTLIDVRSLVLVPLAVRSRGASSSSASSTSTNPSQ